MTNLKYEQLQTLCQTFLSPVTCDTLRGPPDCPHYKDFSVSAQSPLHFGGIGIWWLG
jgi:hypothetical protein